MNYSDICEQYHEAKDRWVRGFDDFLVPEHQYDGHYVDWYDNSITLTGASPDWRLTPAQQAYIRDSGFSVCYVKHTDGWETHYSVHEGVPVRGWRRLSTENGFTISFWPESWTSTEWLETGYIVIEPDPLDPMNEGV